MATALEVYTTEEQRFVARFLGGGKGLNAKHIHKEMSSVYHGKCLSRKAVHNWVEKFSQGRSKFADDDRPGLPVEIAREATV
jgi:truncated hemoglobin YjbI